MRIAKLLVVIGLVALFAVVLAEEDYYRLLGVGKTASDGEIRQAYRRLSKELHPDKTKGDKAKSERFIKVANAYEVLSDAQKRSDYDRNGFQQPHMQHHHQQHNFHHQQHGFFFHQNFHHQQQQQISFAGDRLTVDRVFTHRTSDEFLVVAVYHIRDHNSFAYSAAWNEFVQHQRGAVVACHLDAMFDQYTAHNIGVRGWPQFLFIQPGPQPNVQALSVSFHADAMTQAIRNALPNVLLRVSSAADVQSLFETEQQVVAVLITRGDDLPLGVLTTCYALRREVTCAWTHPDTTASSAVELAGETGVAIYDVSSGAPRLRHRLQTRRPTDLIDSLKRHSVPQYARLHARNVKEVCSVRQTVCVIAVMPRATANATALNSMMQTLVQSEKYQSLRLKHELQLAWLPAASHHDFEIFALQNSANVFLWRTQFSRFVPFTASSDAGAPSADEQLLEAIQLMVSGRATFRMAPFPAVADDVSGVKIRGLVWKTVHVILSTFGLPHITERLVVTVNGIVAWATVTTLLTLLVSTFLLFWCCCGTPPTPHPPQQHSQQQQQQPSAASQQQQQQRQQQQQQPQQARPRVPFWELTLEVCNHMREQAAVRFVVIVAPRGELLDRMGRTVHMCLSQFPTERFVMIAADPFVYPALAATAGRSPGLILLQKNCTRAAVYLHYELELQKLLMWIETLLSGGSFMACDPAVLLETRAEAIQRMQDEQQTSEAQSQEQTPAAADDVDRSDDAQSTDTDGSASDTQTMHAN